LVLWTNVYETDENAFLHETPTVDHFTDVNGYPNSMSLVFHDALKVGQIQK
jgi:hypothetical protein